MGTTYIHGTAPAEQQRLAKLGDLTNEAFLRFLQFDADSIILDVGSGLGLLDRQLALRVPRGEVWGVEQSADQLAHAVTDLPNLHFRQGDAHQLPLEDNRFDVVFCRYVLEHVSDPVQVLREMRRVLKPGGKAFLQENNILVNVLDPECSHFDALWRKFVDLQQRLGGNALVGKKLLRLFRAAGFSDVRLSIQPEVHHHGAPTYAGWVENLIHNITLAEPQLVEHGLASHDEIQTAADEMRQLIANPTGTAIFYWNRAMAIK